MQFLFLGIGELPLWQQAIRGIGILLCKFIYWLISLLFQLFMTVSRLNILSSDEIGPIYQRITMILTIVMVFYITFEFVKYVVQPDTISDKEKGVGNIALKMIIVILLIAFVPKIFSMGYELQNRVIETQVFSKVILGKKGSDLNNFGGDFSANIFSLFYTVDYDVCEDQCKEAQQLIDSNLYKLRTEGSTKYLDNGINEANKVTIDGDTRQRPIINFDGFLAIVVGVFILYILALYSIDVGTRYAQLLFLQIMAPVAIMGYLTPKKDNVFSKWGKQCITTYIDLFIRLAIIYFVLLLIQVLGSAYDSGNLFEGLGNISTSLKMFTYIVLVMGLLVFANKAPKMLQELFPSSGSAGIGFGLKGSDRVAPMAARAIGTSAGGLSGMVRKTGTRLKNENARRREIKQDRLEKGLPTDRAAMRKALNADRKASKASKRNLKDRTKELEGARNKITAAENAIENAKKNGTYEANKARLDNDLVKAKQNFAAVKSGGDARVSENTKRELEIAQKNLTDKKADGSYDKMTKEEKDKLDNAIKKAQEKYNAEARNSYNQAKTDYNVAASKYAKSQNENYGAYIGLQGLGAAVSGLFTGAATGFEATKLEDIKKKIQEVSKNIKESETARIKYLQEGGGATIQASVQRTITQLQQKVGIKTASEIIKEEVKGIEAKVKVNESQASLEKSIKTAQDAIEARSEKKIKDKEQIIAVSTKEDVDKLNKAIGNDKNGSGIQIKVGQTTSQIYAMYENKATTAHAQADAANAELTKAEMNGTATDEMRIYAKQKEEEAGKADDNARAALKQLRNYGATRTMRGDIGKITIIDEFGNLVVEKEDGLLTTNVNTLNQAIENVRNNSESVKYMQDEYALGRTDEHTYNVFINNNIRDYDEMDTIKTKFSNHASALENETSALKETVRAINESSATDAANANAAGGNK